MDQQALPAGPDEMGCYVLLDLGTDELVCTREFGHDGDHVAHGPRGRVVAAWERRATDRTGSES